MTKAAVHEDIVANCRFWVARSRQSLKGDNIELARFEIVDAWTLLPAYGGSSYTQEKWDAVVNSLTTPMHVKSYEIIQKYEDSQHDAELRARHIREGYSDAERKASEAVALSVNRRARASEEGARLSAAAQLSAAKGDDKEEDSESEGGVALDTATKGHPTASDEVNPAVASASTHPSTSTTESKQRVKDFKKICYRNLARKHVYEDGTCFNNGCKRYHLCKDWVKGMIGGGARCSVAGGAGTIHRSPHDSSMFLAHELPNCKFALTGECTKGPDCRYGHDFLGLRNIAEGAIYGWE
ncbi:unnamed protein product [Zymoseptoria tritici ST99CH_3D1]|nr:unnamed protein product [Zymoseptoria tritici ST99CH_3D1]